MNAIESIFIHGAIIGTSITVTTICCAMAWKLLLRLSPAYYQAKWQIILLFLAWYFFALYRASVQGVAISGLWMIFTPLIVGFLLTFYGVFKKLLTIMPNHWLIYLQVYRVAGALFLYLYSSSGLLSAGFAYLAGIGDILTGILAIPVGYLVQHRKKGYLAAALCWNLFGILDLIVAPIAAITFGARGLGIFPIILIPLYLGPPLGTLLHICSLRNLALNKDKEVQTAF